MVVYSYTLCIFLVQKMIQIVPLKKGANNFPAALQFTSHCLIHGSLFQEDQKSCKKSDRSKICWCLSWLNEEETVFSASLPCKFMEHLSRDGNLIINSECAWLQRAAPQRAPHSLTFLTLKALAKSAPFSDIFGSTFISFVLIISQPVGRISQ